MATYPPSRAEHFLGGSLEGPTLNKMIQERTIAEFWVAFKSMHSVPWKLFTVPKVLMMQPLPPAVQARCLQHLEH